MELSQRVVCNSLSVTMRLMRRRSTGEECPSASRTHLRACGNALISAELLVGTNPVRIRAIGERRIPKGGGGVLGSGEMKITHQAEAGAKEAEPPSLYI